MNNSTWQLSLKTIYRDLQQGFDVSPARILGLEGQLSVLLANQTLQFDQLQQAIDQLHIEVFGKSASPLHWQWCESDGVVRVPYHMQVAPVSKR